MINKSQRISMGLLFSESSSWKKEFMLLGNQLWFGFYFILLFLFHSSRKGGRSTNNQLARIFLLKFRFLTKSTRDFDIYSRYSFTFLYAFLFLCISLVVFFGYFSPKNEKFKNWNIPAAQGRLESVLGMILTRWLEKGRQKKGREEGEGSD